MQPTKGTILVLDDERLVLESVSQLLLEYGYSVIPCMEPAKAALEIQTNDIDAVLTDIKMPVMSGIQFLEGVRGNKPDVPVVLMTAYPEINVTIEAIKKGAYDFVIKPYQPHALNMVLERAVKYRRLLLMEQDFKRLLKIEVELKTKELENALSTIKDLTSEIVKKLTRAAEFRDQETGAHIVRIGHYSRLLGEQMGMSQEFVDSIEIASQMHDIGKIGIPDVILLKNKPLSEEEFDIMKTHTSIGERILSGSTRFEISMAASIAKNHHEKWDGTGYPNGLRGEEIPVEARIMTICDTYDALRSRRPYKRNLTHEETVRIIAAGDGRTLPGHFSPDVLEAFLDNAKRFDDIFYSLINETSVAD